MIVILVHLIFTMLATLLILILAEKEMLNYKLLFLNILTIIINISAIYFNLNNYY